MRKCHLITAASTHQVSVPLHSRQNSRDRPSVVAICHLSPSSAAVQHTPPYSLPPFHFDHYRSMVAVLLTTTVQWSPVHSSLQIFRLLSLHMSPLQQRTPMLPKQLGRSGSIFFIVALLESASFCLPFWSHCSFLRSF